MKLPASVTLVLNDTIWELWGVDITPLKTAKDWENRVLTWVPEKKMFSFIKLAGKRRAKKK